MDWDKATAAQIDELLQALRKNNVHGFEVQSLKVTFWTPDYKEKPDVSNARNGSDFDRELGIDYEID
jgi:hypothetical protein